MGAGLDYAAVLEHIDAVDIDDAGEAVRAVDYRFAFHEDLKLGGDGLLGDSVEAASRLVEEEDLGLGLQQASRNKDPLTLTAGQLRAEVANLRLVPVLHLNNLFVDLAFLAHFGDFILGGVGVAVLQIEHDAVIEQRAILRNNGDILAEAIESAIRQVLSIDEHSAALWIVDAEEQIEQRRLSKARRADDRALRARFDGQSEVLEKLLLDDLRFMLVFRLLRLDVLIKIFDHVVLETYVLEVDATLGELKLVRIRLLTDDRLGSQHMVELDYVDTTLVQLAEEGAKVEQRASQLHEQ